MHAQPVTASSLSPERATVDASIDLDASVDEVWRAVSSGTGLAGWLGDGAMIDARVGGGLEAPDVVSGRPRKGLVDRVEPGERLDFRWWVADRPEVVSTVSIRLAEIDGGTRLTVTESIPTVVPGIATAGGRSGAASADASHAAPTVRQATPSVMRAGWVWRLALLSLSVAAVSC